MDNTKIKIKEAAAEQKMEPMEFLSLLRKWEIVTDKRKGAGGAISQDEYEKFKAKRKEAEAPQRIKVRRNNRNAVPEAPRAEARPAETPEAPQAAQQQEIPAVQAEERAAEEKAAAQPEEKGDGEKAAAPQAGGAGDAQEAPAAAAGEDAEASRSSRAKGREKAPKKKISRPEIPPARIISQPAAAKPAEEPAPSQEPQASQEEPAMVQPEVSAPAPAAEGPMAAGSSAEADAGTPQEEQPEAQPAEAAMEPKPEKPRRIPAISADPDGTSRTNIRKVVPEEGRKKPASPEVPSVRVISRPETPQVRIVRPADGSSRPLRDGQRRDDRGGRGPRPDPRLPRGEGRDGAGAPRADGRDSRRPGGNAGRPRPAGAPRGGAPFAPGFPQQPPMENEQSRKKRNKGRRGAGFSEGSEDFSPRRANANVNIGSLIPDMDDDDGVVRTRRSHKPKKQQAPVPVTQPMKAAKRRLRVEESIRVADMAHQMGLKSSEIIKVLFSLGTMATINSALDIDTASVVASEFGYEVEKVGFSEEQLIPSSADTPEMLKPRPPVVTIMGHVDHGKTSLLDAIRKTSVTSGEAGGITQHIGAYHVKTKKGDIVFLDTPGHAAFTAMRARGAQVTDLVVLVVAADDGVMDQTREAINHSRAAGVPILVAVNKIDKPTANPERVLRELSELGLQPEDWGGDTVVGMVSAKTGQGLDDLLELIALQAEILELKANPDKPARGHVVEAKLDKGRGPVATVLVQEGTLHQGDVFVCGVFSGRVRAMFNDQGRKIKQAGPSMPVEVQGFEGVPEAGEEFVSLEDEKAARRIAESRAAKLREKELAKASRVTLETFLKQSADTKETLVLNVVLKADVQGSLEAITESLRKLSTEKVRIEIIHGAAGAISESDVMLATASNAIIIGFNVRPTAKVKEVAEQEHVDIRFYDIIYKLVDEVKSAMAGMLAPVSKEVYLGQAEVRQTFSVPKVGLIAGCMVVDGKLTRTANVRLLRDGVVVYTGKVASLKRLKDDAKEVVRNFECGVGLDNFHDIKIGDIIEAFEMVEEAATLD